MLMQITRALAFTIATLSVSTLRADPDLPGADAVAWATQNYDQVADLTFGDPRRINDSTAADTSWTVITRVRPAYDRPESQFTITESSKGQLALIVIVSEHQSMFKQMLTVHALHPGWNAVDVAQHIHVRRSVVNGPDIQPKLRAVVRRFTSLQTTMRLPNAMIMDANAYHIWSMSGSQWIEINLLGGELSRHPLIRWIEMLRGYWEETVATPGG